MKELNFYIVHGILCPEAAVHGCFKEQMFWKYAANLQENTLADLRFL